MSGFWAIAEEHPDLVATRDSDGTVTTYGELLVESGKVAPRQVEEALQRLRTQPGALPPRPADPVKTPARGMP